LKLTKNDIEIIQSKNKQLELSQKEMSDMNEELEEKVVGLKDQLYKTQKEKDHTQIQLNNKIEILQYKLLNNGTNEENDANKNSIEGTFKELLQLCKGDLTEIIGKVNMLSQNELREDKLRKEIIEQGRKMNELRADHERSMYESNSNNNQKID